MLHQPTVSVVMTNYNHARFLPEALQAILDQSYRPMEIIIIDDASTDNSVDILEQFAQNDPIIRLIRNERNMGVIYNANRLLELASGEYVYFGAADDRVLPGLFEKSMNLLAQYPQAGLCSTLSQVIGENGEDKGILPTAVVANVPTFLPPERVRRVVLSLGNWIQDNTGICRRDALIEAGGYIPELGSFADGFIYQVIALKHGACFIPEPLAEWRRLETGYAATSTRNIEAQLEVVSCATRLMQSRYKDLFPQDYIDLWENGMLFDLGRIAHRSLQVQEEKFLNEMRLLQPNPNLLNQLLHFLLRSLMCVRGLMTMCCLLLGHFPRQAVRRKLHRILHR